MRPATNESTIDTRPAQPCRATAQTQSFWVPSVPRRRDGSSEARRDAWRGWLQDVRLWSRRAGVEPVDRPCRIKVKVMWPTGPHATVVTPVLIDRWREATMSALERTGLVPDGDRQGIEVLHEFVQAGDVGTWVTIEIIGRETP